MPRTVQQRSFSGQSFLLPLLLAVLCVPVCFSSVEVFSQAPTTPSSPPQAKTSAAPHPRSARAKARRRKHPRGRRPAPQAAIQTPSVAAPAAPPSWPVPPAQQPAVPATIQFQDNQLTIDAKNSSLAQILAEVAHRTGMKILGLTNDQRVFGQYGPGTVSQILGALLDGSPYNYVLIGGDTKHPPTELLLTSPNATAVPAGAGAPVESLDTAPGGNANPPQTGLAPAPTGPLTAQQMMDQYRRAHPGPAPAQQEEEAPPPPQ
ncbi:MAG: hypothetical protein ACP5EP_06495 [Acidobacteriaceae bacterium]